MSFSDKIHKTQTLSESKNVHFGLRVRQTVLISVLHPSTSRLPQDVEKNIFAICYNHIEDQKK